MAIKGLLQQAEKLLKSRKFSAVVQLLESRDYEFQDSFEYYYFLGTACMYLGDIGGASRNFASARKISVLDSRLLIAQAALFLRRGDITRALEYYLDIQEKDPSNKIAKEAMEFIRLNGNPETISEWVSSGKIKRFYPPLGIHPIVPSFIRIFVLCLFIGVGFIGFYFYKETTKAPPRADLSSFVLSVDERNNALQEDLSGNVYRYYLTARQINESYDAARNFFQEYRDNAALVEINRLVNSNASAVIRHNVQMLKKQLKEPTFDSIKDSFEFEVVAKDPYLYVDCWVVWTGRLANAVSTDSSFSADLLVGYEKQKRVEGIVPLTFDSAMEIDATLPIRVLGRLGIENGKIHLYGKSVYQPMDGNSL